MQCLHCATENGDAKFCKTCGAVMAAPAAVSAELESMLPCPSCQHENQPSAKFCSKCGHDLKSETSDEAESEPVVAAPPPKEEAAAVAPALETKVAEPFAPHDSTFAQPADESPPAQASGSGIKIAIVLLLVAVLAGVAWWMFQGTTAPAQVAIPAISPSDNVVEPNTPAAAIVPERPPALAAPTVPEAEASSGSLSSTEFSNDADQKNIQPQLSAEEVKAKNAQLQAKKETAEQARLKKAAAMRAAHQAKAQERANAQRAVPVAPATIATSRIDQVMACKRLSFFEKEKCIWSLCHDRWGKDGCPSYD